MEGRVGDRRGVEGIGRGLEGSGVEGTGVEWRRLEGE